MADRIFSPHYGQESYNSYLDRLHSATLEDYTAESKAAALITTRMLMQRGNGRKLVDRKLFTETRDSFLASASFKKMMKDPRVKETLRQNDTDGLIYLLNETEKKRQEDLDRRYKRPEDKAVVAKDAELLKNAIEGLKGSAGTAPTTGSPEIEARGRQYGEMMKQLEHAKTLADHGIQLSGEQTKALITAVKAYNDGGKTHVKPGGEKQAEGFTESMVLLKNYMPAKQFNTYCKLMNTARQVENPGNLDYVSPEAFAPQRLTGARTAKELMAENRRQLQVAFGTEAAAEAMAIRQLSGGDPNKLLRPEEVERQARKINVPGSAFVKAMQDPKTRDELRNLAELGEADEVASDLGKIVTNAAKERVTRTAQGEVNRSIRKLTGGGPLNRYFTQQHLANVLAARELALNATGEEQITNAAFRERAEQVQRDPAFQRMSERYINNPAYRESMNKSLRQDSTARDLAAQYDLEKQPLQPRRDRAQPEAGPQQQENRQPNAPEQNAQVV